MKTLIAVVAWLLLQSAPQAEASAKRKPASTRSFDAESTEDLRLFEQQLAVIEEKIAVTRKEIAKIRDASFLPDLYFALADMHTQKARLLYLIKVQKNPGKQVDTLDFTAEKRPKIEAIEIYQKIYNFFPKEKRRDRALFLTGMEQRDLGQFEQMVRTFNILSREFPQSDHFAEANVVLGDYLFEQKKDVDAAIEAFKRVVNRPITPFTPLAHYRMGWCYVNQTKWEQAIEAYEAALTSQAQSNPDDLPETYRKSDIRREAVVALAHPYVEVFADPKRKKSDMPPPVEYFRKKSPDHFTFRRVMSRAGRRLILKEKWRESAECFYHVSVLSTDFETRFEALQRVNDAHQRKEVEIDFLAFIREIGITVDLLQASLPSPLVFDANALLSLDDELSKQGTKKKGGALPQKPLAQMQFLELLMRDFSTQLHRKARATGSAADFDKTSEAYHAYLDRFPKAPKALDIEYNLAEVEFKGDHLVRAGMQYEGLARDRRLAKRANVFKESAIEAYTKSLQKADTLSLLDRIRARRGLREIGGDWIRANPQAPGAPTAAFNIANSWYEERNLKKAIEAFKGFIEQFPKDQHVRDAVFLIINSYSQLDDYKGLEKAGTQLMKTPSLSEAEQQNIKDAVRRAQTKQLQKVAGDFGTKEYAENLLSVASKYKGSALGVQALYEAFNSMKSKRDPELFEVGETLLDQHADSQYAKEVASSMAMLALSTASFDRAARYLSLFAQKYPNEKESLEFRKTSASLFERQGDFKKARQQYESLGDKASVARMDLVLGDWARLERTSRESGLKDANYWHALAIWRQQRFQDAAPLLRDLARDKSATRDQSDHARFLLAQMALTRFRSIQMKSAEDQQAMAEKIKSFKLLGAELQDLVKGGVGRWPIAGLYLLGQTHYDVGRFIADSPIPQGLAAADRKAYIEELNKQAATYISEADKVFGKCIAAAEANDIFTRYVDGCRSRGRKLVREEDDLANAAAKSSGSEPPQAREIRKKLIDNNKDVNLLFELGEIYVRADQPQTAAGIFERILEIKKDNARAVASVGVASMALGEYDTAYDSFRRALEFDGRDATALWNLAGLYNQFKFKAKLVKLRPKMRGQTPPKLMHPWAKEI